MPGLEIAIKVFNSAACFDSICFHYSHEQKDLSLTTCQEHYIATHQ